jgi:hypothetical protein
MAVGVMQTVGVEGKSEAQMRESREKSPAVLRQIFFIDKPRIFSDASATTSSLAPLLRTPGVSVPSWYPG